MISDTLSTSFLLSFTSPSFSYDPYRFGRFLHGYTVGNGNGNGNDNGNESRDHERELETKRTRNESSNSTLSSHRRSRLSMC
jgi:hypothetical protein